MLMDGNNFARYQMSDAFNYYGSYANATEVQITVPHPGPWHLVVDLGGAIGAIGASFTLIE
jgi:hypothetical protein